MLETNDGMQLIVAGDYLKTLENCEGYYVCPTDSDGKPLGLLVGYTADYDAADGTKKKWVGFAYYNFSRADKWPAVLTFFATEVAEKIRRRCLVPDLIVGAPWAGVKCSQEVARILGCQHIFAEKAGDELTLGRYEGDIRPGMTVAIGEELVNNTSTTGKLVELIEAAGGRVNLIMCAINRSSPFKKDFLRTSDSDPIPIIGVIEIETPQYHQDHPLVEKAIAEGNIIWKPKYAWEQMRATMDAFPPTV